MLLSLLYYFFRTMFLAALEALRLALPGRRPPAADGCVFYEGTVTHVRRAPAKHTLSYPVRYCLVDVDEPPASPYVASLLAAGARLSAAEARELSGCVGRVRALLLPESSGYEQNPICVYYCFDADDVLRCCICEVTNTPWGDRVIFPFAPDGDETPKPLHVSPLQDMRSLWALRATAPDERIHVRVAVGAHPTLGDFFLATLDVKALPAGRVRDPERWAFLMPHRVAWWIYWHALVLLVRKGLPFHGHPKSVAGTDYRYELWSRANSEGWPACPVLADGRTTAAHARPYVWRDATDAPWE